MGKFFEFGQKIEKYDFKVINERDARASAGIMFLLGTISLFIFILTDNIFWANLFTISFIVEFIVRVFINPRFAPYMALASIIVSNQEPDWVEARPKKFAWFLGVILAAIMSYYIIFDILTPARLIVCLICLALLYLESVFGICLGCMLYKRLNIKLYKCPGGVCEIGKKKRSLKASYIVVGLSLLLFTGVFYGLKEFKYHGTTTSNLTQDQIDAMEFDDAESDDAQMGSDDTQMGSKDCTPPQWVVKIGHEQKWLKHHGCKQEAQ